MQFAVGGLALPPIEEWITVTERLRGRVVRELCRAVTGDPRACYSGLADEQRARVSLISGKDAAGRPLTGHRHAYFLLWPDENHYPTRLIVWRRTSFGEDEAAALVRAAESPITGKEKDPWTVYLVPLPAGMPLPQGFYAESYVWHSVTPFVPPASRHRFRPGGRLRYAETTEETARRLVSAAGMPAPVSVRVCVKQPVTWARLHQTRATRLSSRNGRAPLLRPGFRLRLGFEQPVAGPIMIGDSCHYGLGLFAASGNS
jgi:CRISPR-associated protein Csb2